MSEAGIGALAWEWTGVDMVGFNGLAPTNRRVLVRGVTFVEDDDKERTYHRYIDWIGVVGQLGLGFIGRASLPDDTGNPPWIEPQDLFTE
jgi:hypothetical protein